MMFESHIAFGVNLLALVAAAALLRFYEKTEACCKSLLKVVAYVVLVLATLNLLCTSYYTIRYWEDGYFKTPNGEQCPMMKNKKAGMMNMMGDDMMKMKDGKKMNDMNDQDKMSPPKEMPNKDSSDQEHKEHHPE